MTYASPILLLQMAINVLILRALARRGAGLKLGETGGGRKHQAVKPAEIKLQAN